MINHTEIRTPLELWLIVEQNFNSLFHLGLCNVIANLRACGEITLKEERFLSMEIVLYGQIRKLNAIGYIWTVGHEKPRRMFIQKQILKAIRA